MVKSKVDCVLLTLQLSLCKFLNCKTVKTSSQSIFLLCKEVFNMQGFSIKKASLINVNDSFKKIIIVKDVVKPLYDDDGILTMSIYDFLLNEHSLEL